jgi:hypothetical protein
LPSRRFGAVLGLFLASRYRPPTGPPRCCQNITGDEGEVSPTLGSADPMLSIIELLRSRAVAASWWIASTSSW